MNNDKELECSRYDTRAQSLLLGTRRVEPLPVYGSLAIPAIFRAPYSYYEQCIRYYVCKDTDVLELCSGTGLHTYTLVQSGARVLASDLSSCSLEVLSQRIPGVVTRVADIESLPFGSSSFDTVVIAGGLSYGEPTLVDAEIRRVLRKGGTFLCVDSLNHNPFYRVNRWLHYWRGGRTRSTLRNMPTTDRIRSISRGFKIAEVRYFGAISFLMPFLAGVIGQSHAAKISDAVDRLLHVRREAFKFVLVARERL